MSEAMTLEEREASIGGIGTARKRKEDARFIRGKGNYVDDIKLEGMLHGDFVRSSHAHALIKSIDTEAALKVPGVLAVVTAKELEPLSLHWMPTLAGGHGRRPGRQEGAFSESGNRVRRREPTATRRPTAYTRSRSSTRLCRPSSIPRRRSTTMRP